MSLFSFSEYNECIKINNNKQDFKLFIAMELVYF